ncbi:MAG TPA: S8 family serine peptidase [Acidobacteriota bacterium]
MLNPKLWRIGLPWSGLLVLLGSAHADPSVFVRMDAAAAQQAWSAGIRPEQAYDYGGFIYLELEPDAFAELAASGVAYQLDAEAAAVRVRDLRFDPLHQAQPGLAEAAPRSPEAAGLRLIQFRGPVVDAWLDTLRDFGLPMLQYYPANTFLTWGSAAAADAAAGFPFVRWQGEFLPAYKTHHDLEGRSGPIENVDVMFYRAGDEAATLQALEALGATLVRDYPAQPDRAFWNAIVRVDAAALGAIAALDTVLALSYSSPVPILEDEMSSQIAAGNYTAGVPFTGYFSWLTGLGLDGSGVIWSIVDTGIDYDHPDLSSHISGGHAYPGACAPAGQPGSDCSGGGHGTHVAGIVGGDATGAFSDVTGFLYGLGIAPGVSLHAQNSLSAPPWPPAGGWQEHSKRGVLGGAIGGNNSWTTGEGLNHGYQASERTHDIMVLDGNFDTTSVAEPFIEVFSAGNSGPSASTLTAPKEGKNLIVVANSLNFRAGSIDLISSSSSRGPAVDGRRVPTVAAPGSTIASTRNDLGGLCATAIAGTNNLYAFCSGTSMAAPHVSGSIALITEWWRGRNGGADPSSALAKALLVNGAVDMGTADIPNIHEGWGRVNLQNVLDTIPGRPEGALQAVYVDQAKVFAGAGETYTLKVNVPDTGQPLKITLAWADAPGAVGANPALVNNLNLTVVSGGNTYRGNVFSAGWSTTGGSADSINNLENVYIQSPGADAIITIDAANIAGDAVLYNADPTDQAFALVCHNCSLPNAFVTGTGPGASERLRRMTKS